MTNIAVSERVKWVGASESAALFGVSPHMTRFELFHIKAGNIPQHNLDDVERIQAGQFLEPSIGAWAAYKWDWPVRNVAVYLPHQKVVGMGCSLDFETESGEPVEIKNVDNLVFRDGDWQAEDDIILDAPAHFLIQVQHQMACRPGVDRGWLVVCVGGNRLYRMEIPRHGKMIGRIEREVEQFWTDIHTGNEPRPDFQADAGTISLLYGGNGDEIVDLREDTRILELCDEYRAAHSIETAASKRKSAAMAEIKTLMRDARKALVADGYTVSASHIKGGTYEKQPYWRFNVSKKEK